MANALFSTAAKTMADAASVRSFHRHYVKDVAKIKERAKPLVASGSVTTKTVRAVNLKFYVNAD